MSKQKRAKAETIDGTIDSREKELSLAAEAAGQDEEQVQVASAPTAPTTDEPAPHKVQNVAERMAIIEALIFVSDEPLSAKTIAEVLKEDRAAIEAAVAQLAEEFNMRNGGLQMREVAGGWQFATRPEHHEHVRAFLKSRPSAKLSLAALETLAVISYKQPITIPGDSGYPWSAITVFD